MPEIELILFECKSSLWKDSDISHNCVLYEEANMTGPFKHGQLYLGEKL